MLMSRRRTIWGTMDGKVRLATLQRPETQIKSFENRHSRKYRVYDKLCDTQYYNVCNVWEGQSGNLAQTWVLWKPSLQKMIHPSPKVIPTNSNVQQQQQQQKPKPWLKVKKSTAGSCRLDFICIFCLSCSVTTCKRRTLAIIILI